MNKDGFGSMDDLVREMLGTLDAYMDTADSSYCALDGTVCHVLVAYDSCDSVRITTTFPRATFHQPPVELEEEYGFTGIAAHYALPRGLTPVALQAYAEIMRHAEAKGDISTGTMNDKLGQVMAALTARNPALEALRIPDGRLSLYNAILGVASAFNTDDIQFFLDHPDAPDTGSTAYERLWEKTRPVEFCWIPSPQTLQNVVDQIAAKKDFRPPVRRFSW